MQIMDNLLLDFIFPKKCVHCGTFGQYICKDCEAKMKPIKTAICPMCERPAIDGKTHPGCQTRYCLDGLTSLYRYDGPVRAAIKRLKYKPYLVELVDLLLVSILDSMKSNKDVELAGFTIISIPLHPQRERERGFNQAALIGKALALQLDLPFDENVLQRTRYTKPQVLLAEKERRKNLADAFILDTKYKILNTNILLVDDVWTTGSTMRACANVLKRAGAKKVWALTVAR